MTAHCRERGPGLVCQLMMMGSYHSVQLSKSIKLCKTLLEAHLQQYKQLSTHRGSRYQIKQDSSSRLGGTSLRGLYGILCCVMDTIKCAASHLEGFALCAASGVGSRLIWRLLLPF